MKSITNKLLFTLLSVACLLGMYSSKVEAKILSPDLETKAADYYITEDASETVSGEVSAKLQNKLVTIEIPETVIIEGKEYTVTAISGLCYPDYPDSSLKQDAYRCAKNKKTKTIILPKTIHSIEKGTFTNFTKLKIIRIAKDNKKFKCVKGSVVSKNGKILYGTVTQKGTYKVPTGVKTIASRAFAYSKVNKVVLPSSCKKIQTRAFYRCTSLNTVTNVKKVKMVGEGAFYKTKLKNVTKDGRIEK
ncbi:MAG: leucine-rich repeat domain-containing protein [Lachnospiraceae bacterium]|nr:leucine-rich repeat domain-containing protein [Lachnospiraceae bacterium]